MSKVSSRTGTKARISATLARRRLRELKKYYGGVASMQHNLFISAGLRVDRTSFYGWLQGVRCPEGRVLRLAPTPLYLVTKWIQGHEHIVQSRNKEPFIIEHWWTPVESRRQL